jgi:hypothetical protein
METGFVKSVGINLSEGLKTIPKKRKSQLQPVFEALMNSFEALPLLNKVKINIKLYVHRDLFTEKDGKSQTESFSFIKMLITDNGKGFDEIEFTRFSTLWDNSKLPNNRGTGRVQFLHFFKETSFSSIYKERPNIFRKREFVLSKSLSFLSENAIIRVDKDEPAEEKNTSTTIVFQKPNDENDEKFYAILTPEIIKEIVIQQFLDYFCDNRGSLPKIVIERYIDNQFISKETIKENDIPVPDHSNSLTVSYSKLVNNKIISSEIEESFNVKVFILDERQHPKNEIVLTSKGAVAKSYPIECLLPKDVINGKRYLVLVSGQYIDTKDSDERGEIKILSENDYLEQYKDTLNPDEVILLDTIKNETNIKIRELCPEIKLKYEEKQQGIDALQEMFLLNEQAVNEAKTKIKIDDTDEDMLTKVYQSKAKMSAKKDAEIKKILKGVQYLDPNSANYLEEIKQLSGKLVTEVPEQNKSDLAQYIARRRIVLECFEKILKNELEKLKKGNKISEDILHNLIFQQSSKDPENSDLWLINEEFIYYNGYSENRLSQIKINNKKIFKNEFTEEEEKALKANGGDRLNRRPDVLLFPDEGKCIIIEFKSPGVDVTKHLAQLDQYANLILNYTKDGYLFKTFYGYLIGEAIERRDVLGVVGNWEEAPHFKYYFRPSSRVNAFDNRGDGSIYTEVIKYSILLERAQIRNKIFIEKLGKGILPPKS